MPEFTLTSRIKLATCDQDLQTLFNEVIKTFDCTILEGHRDEEAQEEAFKKGNTKLHWPNGKHNSYPSNAVDASIYPVQWNNLYRFYWFAGYVMGIATKLYDDGKISHLIRYGGDWNSNREITDNNFNDLVHFELIK
jgi:peptidoglycan L-alanyl-D-glutamate endopeptidase CwlK